MFLFQYMANKAFVFKNVVLIKPYLFVLMAVAIEIVVIITVTRFFASSVKLLSFFTLAGLTLVLIIGKVNSKTVTISFTDANICFNINGQLQVYPKTELKGFYSFNYLHTSNCMLVMDFYLKNGHVINLYDYQTNYDSIKHETLKSLLTTAQTELGFEPVATSKFRTWTNTANVWFAKAPSNLI